LTEEPLNEIGGIILDDAGVSGSSLTSQRNTLFLIFSALENQRREWEKRRDSQKTTYDRRAIECNRRDYTGWFRFERILTNFSAQYSFSYFLCVKKMTSDL